MTALEQAAYEAARTGNFTPPDCDLLDTALFTVLYHLYALYLAGHVSREQASDYKQRVMSDYQTQRAGWEIKQKIYRQAQSREIALQGALMDYGVKPCLETADALYNAILRLDAPAICGENS